MHSPYTVLLALVFTIHIICAHPSHSQNYGVAPFHVTITHNRDPTVLSILQKESFSVDHRRSYNEIDAYINQEQWDLFRSQGVDVSLIKEVHKRDLNSDINSPVLSPSGYVALNAYMDQEQLKEYLVNITTTYPNITRLINIGHSVQGKELLVLQISKNPDVNSFEPKFKYIGNMHGDEVVGRMMLIYLIDYLTYNYKNNNPEIVQMIDNTDIYIMPTMNPDGYAARVRQNANNIDLNRNFPDMWQNPSKAASACEPEVQAVMNFSLHHNFVLSANLHGGDLCANYPFDGNDDNSWTYSRAPDDEVFRVLALTYALKHTKMNQYSGSSGDKFFGGTTNGASWYPLFGGMQDWNYLWTGDFELTLELSFDKTPPASDLPTYWDDNRNALLEYIAAVNKLGIKGRVTDKKTGVPLDAQITIDDIPTVVYSDPAHGGYFRLLLPGTYKVNVYVPGYTNETKEVKVTTETISLVDFALSNSNAISQPTSKPSTGNNLSSTLSVMVALVVIMSSVVIVMGIALFMLQRQYKRVSRNSDYEHFMPTNNA